MFDSVATPSMTSYDYVIERGADAKALIGEVQAAIKTPHEIIEGESLEFSIYGRRFLATIEDSTIEYLWCYDQNGQFQIMTGDLYSVLAFLLRVHW